MGIASSNGVGRVCARRCAVLLLVWSLAASTAVAQPVEERLDDDRDVSGAIALGVAAGTMLSAVASGVSLVALGPTGRVALEGRAIDPGPSERPVAGLVVGGAILVGAIVGGTFAGLGAGDGVTGALSGMVGGVVVAAPMGFVTSATSSALNVVAADINTLLVLSTSGTMGLSALGGVSAVFASATACGFGNCAAIDQIVSGTLPKQITDSDDSRAKQRAARIGSLGATIGCVAGSMVSCSPIVAALAGGDVLLAAVGPIAGSAVLSFAGAALMGEPVVGLATAAGAAVGTGASTALVGGGVALVTKGAETIGLLAVALALPVAVPVGTLALGLPTISAGVASCVVGACSAADAVEADTIENE